MKQTPGIAAVVLAAVALLGAAAAPQGPAGVRRQQVAERLVDRLAAGDFTGAGAEFDEAMRTALPPAKLAGVWVALKGQAGAFQGRGGTRPGREAGYDMVFVTCRFASRPLDAKVVFDDAGKIAGLFFAPSAAAPAPGETSMAPYATPAAFKEKEIRVGSGQWVLPGTLTLPAGAGPFPALVLVHGSGPLDRDETVGPNKPFRDIAAGLASRGVAVLRYDKRTLAHKAAMAALPEQVTLKEETIDDAVAAVALLRAERTIDAGRLFLLGHSLGGIAVPRIGALDPKIAGFILCAAPSRPLEEIILDQITYIAGLDGDISAEERERLDEMQIQIKRLRARGTAGDPIEGELPLGLSRAYWSDLSRGTEPAATARLRQPLLVLQGGRDYQVTTVDFDGWKRALAARSGVEMKLFPDLNHLFMAGSGKSRPEEYQTPGHVAPEVVETIARWIKARG